ncbi:MAG TPA: M1 family aminopeptidase, partial [Longimicrobium sp.]
NPEGEITGEGDREQHGLARRPRTPSIGDARARNVNFISRDADWVTFEATVVTDADQTAVAPGYLQRSWKEGNRRYFHYRMDAPILNFYAFLSGRYAVRRDRWRNVAIEVYHHPPHGYNVERMVGAVKKSLDYYTAEFGPYQHRQVRVLEFPRYAEFAQSFANTIPYSEGIGFIADVRKDDIDYPFFVTAHEVAHQWWGHQLVGADVQGAAMLSETLSEYSALMVMEREFGRAKIGRFLRYELDQYLRGRGGEGRAELPLALVEQQQYIHYNKGALAMYALRDYIGEERVNAALRSFLDQWKYRGPPYPTSRDLLVHLRAATPDSLRYLIGDLFESVTLYDNRTESATSRRLGPGRYEVELRIRARKVRADSLGTETEVPLDDRIEIGVFGPDKDVPLYLAKHRIRAGVQTVRVQVKEAPERAGIDPLHKLIDRAIEDNTKDLN